jgi:small subunit ribosomal protein S7
MKDGKKSTAERILYDALETIKERTGEDPMKVFKRAIENVKPAVEVRPNRRLALSLRWLIQSALKRSEKTMNLRLAGELMDASGNRGVAIKKKEDTHRMAEANKAFAHYRW